MNERISNAQLCFFLFFIDSRLDRFFLLFYVYKSTEMIIIKVAFKVIKVYSRVKFKPSYIWASSSFFFFFS